MGQRTLGCLMDVKCITVCPSHFGPAKMRQALQCEAVARKGRAVDADYRAKARRFDAGHNATPVGATGPVEARLREFGRVWGLAFGPHGDVSPDVKALVALCAAGAAARESPRTRSWPAFGHKSGALWGCLRCAHMLK